MIIINSLIHKQTSAVSVIWVTNGVRTRWHTFVYIYSLLGQEAVSIYNLKCIDRFYIHLIGLKIRVYVYVVYQSHSHFQESDISILSEKLFISRHIQGICTLIYIKRFTNILSIFLCQFYSIKHL